MKVVTQTNTSNKIEAASNPQNSNIWNIFSTDLMDIQVVDSTGRPPACFGKTCYIYIGVTVNHANIASAPGCITEYSYTSICP